MDISHVEPLLRQYGVDDELIEELRSAAAGLPPELTDGSLSRLAKIDGLTDTNWLTRRRQTGCAQRLTLRRHPILLPQSLLDAPETGRRN